MLYIINHELKQSTEKYKKNISRMQQEVDKDLKMKKCKNGEKSFLKKQSCFPPLTFSRDFYDEFKLQQCKREKPGEVK